MSRKTTPVQRAVTRGLRELQTKIGTLIGTGDHARGEGECRRLMLASAHAQRHEWDQALCVLSALAPPPPIPEPAGKIVKIRPRKP